MITVLTLSEIGHTEKDDHQVIYNTIMARTGAPVGSIVSITVPPGTNTLHIRHTIEGGILAKLLGPNFNGSRI